MNDASAPTHVLPGQFTEWFARRGWQARPHQVRLAEVAARGDDALLIAPTGGGKTLAGFLPSLIDLARDPRPGLHTLYVSPLKALTYDIAQNLDAPVREMALPVSLETRTGDTPQSKRQRQKTTPPNILLTTPEQLALLLAAREAKRLFQGLGAVIIDELHAFADTRRGDLLALDLARLKAIAPGHRRVGLSATVAEPERLARFVGRGGDRRPLSVARRDRDPTSPSCGRRGGSPGRGTRHGMSSRKSTRRSATTAPCWSSSIPAARRSWCSRSSGG